MNEDWKRGAGKVEVKEHGCCCCCPQSVSTACLEAREKETFKGGCKPASQYCPTTKPFLNECC